MTLAVQKFASKQPYSMSNSNEPLQSRPDQAIAKVERKATWWDLSTGNHCVELLGRAKGLLKPMHYNRE